MKIKLTTVYVDDQEKALRFYTDVLGLTKKADFSNGPYRWLTVVSPEAPDGVELQLALNDNPGAKPTSRLCSSRVNPRSCSSAKTSKATTSASRGAALNSK
jgi:catechol 2,3-dioxygenase-like lactoylglutathione lyase family enzyme